MEKIKFNSSELARALSLVNSVVLAKNSLPILSSVRIETKARGDGAVIIELMTSDSETWLQWHTDVVEAESGIKLCVESKSLLLALRNLGESDVVMEIDDEKHSIVCNYDNGHFSLPYDDVAEFPLPINTDEHCITKVADARKVLYAIERASYATANDELRPVMNGVHFDFFKDGMVTVASDGHKLSKFKDLSIVGDNDVVQGFTLPKKPSNTLMNVLASTISGDVKIVFSDRLMTVSNTQFKLTTRLIEGNYPNYDSVIPKNNEKVIIVNNGAFVSAMKRVLPMGNTTSELVSLTFDNGVMTIAAEDYDFSRSASESITCDYNYQRMVIGFRGSTLLQLLQNTEGENVKLLLSEPNRAGVITEESANSIYEYTSLIMPMLIEHV